MAWFDDLVLVKGDLPNAEALRARPPQPAPGKPRDQTPLYRNLARPRTATSTNAAWAAPGAS